MTSVVLEKKKRSINETEGKVRLESSDENSRKDKLMAGQESRNENQDSEVGGKNEGNASLLFLLLGCLFHPVTLHALLFFLPPPPAVSYDSSSEHGERERERPRFLLFPLVPSASSSSSSMAKPLD